MYALPPHRKYQSNNTLDTDIITAQPIIHDGIIHAREGSPAKSLSIVNRRSVKSPSVYIASVYDNNQIKINDTFAVTLRRGQIYHYDGTAGDTITSTKGHTGLIHVDNNSIMPLQYLSYSDVYFVLPPRTVNPILYITAGALGCNVSLYAGSEGQPRRTLSILPYRTVTTSLNTINTISVHSDNPVMVSVTKGLISQSRLIMPPHTRLIGHIKGAQVTAIDNADLTITTNHGTTHNITVTKSIPVSLANLIDEDDEIPYNEGFCIIQSDKPISASSFGDGNDNVASPFYPVNLLGTTYGIPLPIPQGSTIHLSSEYAGTVRFYDQHETLQSTVTLEHKNLYTGVINADSQLNPGYLICDEPTYVVCGFDTDDTVLSGVRD